jgi:iron complex transport system substrate-binding protein
VSLGLVDRLVGHDRFDYVSSPEVRERINSGAMIEVGDGVRLNIEILIDLDPDLVFAFSIGNPELDILGILREARIPFVVDAAYMESSPLARAEWIKYTALHFNKEAEAQHLFEDISSRYQELVRLGKSAEKRPTVLAGAPFRGTWHVPGGASFQARFLADAGGDYLWSEDSSTGSIPLDFEAVYGRALHADLWLNPSDWRSLADGRRREERMADFSAFQAGSVFNNDRRLNERGGNDYWESGSLRPDIVLADLIKILHPQLLPNHELVFYRRLP